MDALRLNPVVRNVSLYEKSIRKDECVAYDSRLIYIISGDVSAVVGGKKLGHLSPGHILFIPAGVPYKLKTQGVRAVVVAFDPDASMPMPANFVSAVPVCDFQADLCHSTADFSPFDKVMHLTEMESERDELIKMSKLFTSGEGNFRAELSARLKLILLRLCEGFNENALPSRMVESLDDYIRENISEEISNTEIGAIFGYHPFYVSRVLKEKKGQTLRQYIISHRLKLSLKLLEATDKSVAEIAGECGFTDASYFTKTFRQNFGMTPKDYRNQYKQDFI